MAPAQPEMNGEVYRLRLAADIPIIVVGAGWSLYAFPQIYGKDPTPKGDILALDKKNIPAIDRWAAGKTNPAADKASDFFLYGGPVVPFLLLFDKEIRKDALKIATIYLETMSVTGLYYTGTPYFIDRYRPETYNTNIPVEDRTTGNNRNSFLGGHPACVAASTFFAAKVYSDYHPESNLKYAWYGLAIAATGTTVYLRHIAGKHFPTDLAAGVAMGTLTGILVPHFHKIKNGKEKSMSILPIMNGKQYGVYAAFRFR